MTPSDDVESPAESGTPQPSAGKGMRDAAVRRRRRPGRPRAGSEDKRERILNEAVRLFGIHGYAGTSLAGIADAADISKAGLLHHFSSKDELFAQVLARRDRDNMAVLLPGVNVEDDPWSFLDGFATLVEHNTHQRDLVAIYTATTASVLDAAHPAHDWFAGHLLASVGSIEEALEAGKERGFVRPEAPSLLIARSMTALSDGLQIQWLCSTTKGTSADPALATSMADEVRLYGDMIRERWATPAGLARHAEAQERARARAAEPAAGGAVDDLANGASGDVPAEPSGD